MVLLYVTTHYLFSLRVQGMVEKWLLQVEDVMISSVRKVIIDSTHAYPTTPRNNWVLSWPGQVVLCVSSMFWTTEVADAMAEEGGKGLAVRPIIKLSPYKHSLMLTPFQC